MPHLLIRHPARWPATLLALSVTLSGCAGWRVDRAAQVATGFTSHLLCNDVFVSGVDPETAFRERIEPLPGMGLVLWGLRREVDVAHQEVRVSVAGAFESRARHRPATGCLALPARALEGLPDPGDEPTPSTPPALPDAAQTVAPHPLPHPTLQPVLQRALAAGPAHRTKALVVLQDGRLLDEAYAPGWTARTPVLGFSATKSITNALVGILVQQGRLAVQQPAPVPAWAAPGDPRAAITVEHLLRQTSGLDLRQDNSGFDRSTQILYTAIDKAAEVAAAGLAHPPGSAWNYTDANYILLSRLVRDAVGGRAEDVLAFARRELFGPLGLQHVQLDFDSTGTPIGASHALASARDWARFGQLYLDDGVVDGRRILPPGWVAWSATPTLNTGYGAGWWTNRQPGRVPGWGVPWGLPSAPADAFFARGFMGQFVVVVPSQRLVLVRLSVSHQRGDDIEETDRIVGEVLAALAKGPAAALRDTVRLP